MLFYVIIKYLFYKYKICKLQKYLHITSKYNNITCKLLLLFQNYCLLLIFFSNIDQILMAHYKIRFYNFKKIETYILMRIIYVIK